jgi:hypothetical protein
VLVAAAKLPVTSRATAPTVSPCAAGREWGDRDERLRRPHRLRRRWHEPVLDGKASGTLRGIKDMSSVLERCPSNGNRMQKRGQRAYRARSEMPAVHDCRVKLNETLFGERRADSGVETRVSLEIEHGPFHGIEGRTARPKELGGSRSRPATGRNAGVGPDSRRVPRPSMHQNGPRPRFHAPRSRFLGVCCRARLHRHVRSRPGASIATVTPMRIASERKREQRRRRSHIPKNRNATGRGELKKNDRHDGRAGKRTKVQGIAA